MSKILSTTEMQQAIDLLTTDLAEADRRAGAAERQLSNANMSAMSKDHWEEEAKVAVGFHPSVPFEQVWDYLVTKAKILDDNKGRGALRTSAVVNPRESALPCPFCGSSPEGTFLGPMGLSAVNCSNRKCIAHCRQVSIEEWNTRFVGVSA
jgi:hypothetical protein